jgi:ABC-type transport system involved in multi-copper enzyme maturation permease subunit
MGRLIKNELYKTFRLKKSYLLMLVVVGIEVAVALQGKYGGVNDRAMISGQDFPFLLLNNLPLLFVIYTAVFIADSWVDECRSGALKLPLLRPVSRTALLSAKVISFFMTATVLMGFTLLSAYGVGWGVFGWGEVTNIGGVLMVLESGAVILLPVLGFGLLILFVAVLTEHMVVTVGVAFGLLLISHMLEVSEGMRDYSIIYMMRAFYQNIFLQFDPETIILNMVVIAAYIVLFYLGSVLVFRKKDMLV